MSRSAAVGSFVIEQTGLVQGFASDQNAFEMQRTLLP